MHAVQFTSSLKHNLGFGSNTFGLTQKNFLTNMYLYFLLSLGAYRQPTVPNNPLNKSVDVHPLENLPNRFTLHPKPQ